MSLDFLYIPIIILLGLAFIRKWRNEISPKNLKVLRYLFFFHLLIGVYYCFFIYGDANTYWHVSRTYNFSVFKKDIFNGEGTIFVNAFNYIFSHVLGMSYLANTLLFSLFGFIGMTYFYLIAIKTIPYTRIINGYALFPLIFFLPNMHFWSVAIGKDSTLFLCIGMFAYGVMKPMKRIPMITLSLLLAMAIRPHIVLFLFVGFGLAYILGGKVSAVQRIAFSALLIGAGFVLLPRVMEYANIEEASVEAFDDFSEKKADVLSRSHTGSAVDISSYPFPLKVATFLFRPLFFDARNLNGLIASAENLILVLLFFKAMKAHPIRAFKAAPFVIKGLTLFLILGTLAFSQSLGNVGIMIRMRNMFLPGLILFLLWTYSYQIQTRLKQKKLQK